MSGSNILVLNENKKGFFLSVNFEYINISICLKKNIFYVRGIQAHTYRWPPRRICADKVCAENMCTRLHGDMCYNITPTNIEV